MSNPYGPPPGGGQQGPGQYGGSGAPSWATPQGGPSFGAPAGSPYGQSPAPQGAGPQGPGLQGAPGYGQGAPGQGTPGQGAPGQSGPGQWTGTPPKAKAPVDLGAILPLVLGGLGVLGFIFGWLPGLTSVLGDGIGSSISEKVFLIQGYLPILLLIVGLLAVAPRLPGGKAYPLPTALLAVAAFLGAIGALTAGTPEGAKSGIGLILILIVALLQVGAAGYAWLLSTGAAKAKDKAGKPATTPAPSAPGFGSNSGPSAPAPSSPAAPSGFGGYASGAYSQAPGSAPAQAPEVPSYGGYGSGSYSPPAGQGAPAYNPYTQPASSEPSQNTGSTPAVPSYGSGSGAPTSGTPAQGASSTGQHGRDDGPPPDVTQQVRF